MHLGDRRGRDRLLVELGEQLLDRTAELDLDDGTHILERLGRDLVAEQLELVDELVGEEALAAGDDLAELHVARPETVEGVPQATRDAAARLRSAVLEHEPACEGTADHRHRAREAAERRQSTRCEETRHLLPRPPAEPVDLPAPRKVVGVDHPRSAVAERAELEVG